MYCGSHEREHPKKQSLQRVGPVAVFNVQPLVSMAKCFELLEKLLLSCEMQVFSLGIASLSSSAHNGHSVLLDGANMLLHPQ